MSLPVVYLPQAEDDIDAAYLHYEERSLGLGDRFLEVLQELAGGIAANPELYATIHQDVRAAPLRRFPYVVYYRVEVSHILIIAVLHGRRSASRWQGRV
jgi:plasmid stabilization system protein ParE